MVFTKICMGLQVTPLFWEQGVVKGRRHQLLLKRSNGKVLNRIQRLSPQCLPVKVVTVNNKVQSNHQMMFIGSQFLYIGQVNYHKN